MQVQYYDAILEKLAFPQSEKIRKIIANGCLKKINTDLYVCNPILGYNVTAYTLRRDHSGGWICNCQGNRKKGYCSHANALKIILKVQGETEQGTLF